MNVMIYMRGNRVGYDDWAAGGAEGWSYDEVLPYFRRAEDNERGADEYHGVGGPLTVSDGRSLNLSISGVREAILGPDAETVRALLVAGGTAIGGASAGSQPTESTPTSADAPPHPPLRAPGERFNDVRPNWPSPFVGDRRLRLRRPASALIV